MLLGREKIGDAVVAAFIEGETAVVSAEVELAVGAQLGRAAWAVLTSGRLLVVTEPVTGEPQVRIVGRDTSRFEFIEGFLGPEIRISMPDAEPIRLRLSAATDLEAFHVALVGTKYDPSSSGRGVWQERLGPGIHAVAASRTDGSTAHLGASSGGFGASAPSSSDTDTAAQEPWTRSSGASGNARQRKQQQREQQKGAGRNAQRSGSSSKATVSSEVARSLATVAATAAATRAAEQAKPRIGARLFVGAILLVVTIFGSAVMSSALIEDDVAMATSAAQLEAAAAPYARTAEAIGDSFPKFFTYLILSAIGLAIFGSKPLFSQGLFKLNIVAFYAAVFAYFSAEFASTNLRDEAGQVNAVAAANAAPGEQATGESGAGQPAEGNAGEEAGGAGQGAESAEDAAAAGTANPKANANAAADASAAANEGAAAEALVDGSGAGAVVAEDDLGEGAAEATEAERRAILAQAERAVRTTARRLKACFGRSDGVQATTAALEFTFGANGRVRNVRATGLEGDADGAVARCLVKFARTIRVATRPQGIAKVRVPLDSL